MFDQYGGSGITGVQGQANQVPSNSVRRGELTAQILRKLLGARRPQPIARTIQRGQENDGMIGAAGGP